MGKEGKLLENPPPQSSEVPIGIAQKAITLLLKLIAMAVFVVIAWMLFTNIKDTATDAPVTKECTIEKKTISRTNSVYSRIETTECGVIELEHDLKNPNKPEELSAQLEVGKTYNLRLDSKQSLPAVLAIEP